MYPVLEESTASQVDDNCMAVVARLSFRYGSVGAGFVGG